jgi:hypothetical protein
VGYSKTYKTKPVFLIPECKELHIDRLHHVLQPLLCKKEAGAGSMNVVRKCEGCRMHEESRMEMEAAEEEAFFVNVLVIKTEGLEGSDSVSQEEEEESMRLEQGLIVNVSGKEHATRERVERREREEIRRQLGDSPRMCRRQEIMDMDMEELEKELVAL